MLRYLILGLVVVMFTGCFGKPEPVIQTKIIYKDKIIFLKPPSNLISRIDIPSPPDKKKFINSTNISRINILSLYTIELLNKLGSSNDKTDSLRLWLDKQEKIYK